MSADLSAAEARHLAIAAQGLAQPRPAHCDRSALLTMMRRLGAVQLDSVNVLTRSHYLPAWSRLGSYAPDHLDDLARRAPRALFEYWGHEASLLPVELQPLLRWRMARAGEDAWGNIRAVRRRYRLLADVLSFISERGPIGVADLEIGAKRKQRGGWWGWSDAKLALEWLFWSGQVTAAGRRGFERLYDLPDRVLPEEVLATPTPAEDEAQRGLIERAALAMGVATEADLRDYYRLPLAGARAAVIALVDSGTLQRVRVEGWSKPGYLAGDARTFAASFAPSAGSPCATLLSPFDSLIWARDRTERLFGMRVRLEVYTPEAKRIHGYYVLPFLLADQLVARVDLKADRASATLLVQASHLEPKAARSQVATALAGELQQLARWLGLSQIRVERRGKLAAALGRELAPRRQARGGRSR
jgi:uncharacterized protein